MPSFRSTQSNEGDLISLETLFVSLEKPLLIYAFKITEGQETAQDVVQEAFLRLQKSLEKVRSPKAWLYRTVHNLAITLRKKEDRMMPLLDDEHSPKREIEFEENRLPHEELERVEIMNLTREFIRNLDTRSQAIVELKFDEGLSYAEIAKRMDVSVSNVGYLLHHAVNALSLEFEKRRIER